MIFHRNNIILSSIGGDINNFQYHYWWMKFSFMSKLSFKFHFVKLGHRQDYV